MRGHVVATEIAENGTVVRLIHTDTEYVVVVHGNVVTSSVDYYRAEDMFTNVITHNRVKL